MIQLFMLSFPIHNMISDNIANTPNTNWQMEQIRSNFFIVYLTFMHKKGLPHCLKKPWGSPAYVTF